MRNRTGILLFALLINLAGGVHAAIYQVSFNPNWDTASLDPGAGVPSNAHFTSLVGATHEPGSALWQANGLASQGIENVAELGSSGALKAEVDALISSGKAGEYISVPGTFDFPGTGTSTFEILRDKPEVSLISMIAPSPDWFVGIYGTSLLSTEGEWIDSLIIDLLAWDAGTEGGTGFSLNNPATMPRERIKLLTDADSPFNGSPDLGQIKFELLSSPVTPVPLPAAFWLFASGIFGLVSLKFRKAATK